MANANVTIIQNITATLTTFVSVHPASNTDSLVAAVNEALATATTSNPSGINAAISSAVAKLVSDSAADLDLSSDAASLDSAISAFTASGGTIDSGLAAAATALDSGLAGGGTPTVDTPETTAAVAGLQTFVNKNFS